MRTKCEIDHVTPSTIVDNINPSITIATISTINHNDISRRYHHAQLKYFLNLCPKILLRNPRIWSCFCSCFCC